VSSVNKIWDYSAQEGGPIIRDKLWFYFSARKWGNELPIANSFRDNGEQHVSWGEIIGFVPRLTWQATPRNKFVAHLERLGKYTGPRLDGVARYPDVPTLANFKAAGLISDAHRGNDPETATTWKDGKRPYGAHYIKWTSPVTNRLLLEAGRSTSFILDGYPNQNGVDAELGTPEFYRNVRYTDTDLGVNWGNSGPVTMRVVINHEYNAAAAYVTGSHNMKFGIQKKDAQETRSGQVNGGISAVTYRTQGGITTPSTVTVNNYPVDTDPRLNHDVGVYAQDRWAYKRMTATVGLRVEWLESGVPAKSVAAGRFVGERHFDEVEDVPKFGAHWSPRLGLAYDLFGNAKTAVKFAVGKYYTRVMTTYAAQLNPMAAVTQTIPWSDPNRDGIVQDSELNLALLPPNFGSVNLARLDPDFGREYNVETGVSVQHEILPNVSGVVGWYRRSFGNMFLGGNDAPNTAWTFDDFRPVELVNPYNGEAFTAYDLKSSSTLARVNRLITNSDSNKQVYHGFEYAVEARLGNGGTILANATTQRALTDLCDVSDDPNKLRYCDRFNLPGDFGIGFKTDFKIAVSYPLPYGFNVSANFTSLPGRTTANVASVDELLAINWTISQSTRYTAADCVSPRPCTPGALVIPNMQLTSLVIPLVPAGSVRQLERQNQLNFSVQKRVRVNRVELVPELSLYNMLNADTILNENTNFGTVNYGVPSAVLQGRLMRLAVRLRW
jgi:hypothetical protein